MWIQEQIGILLNAKLTTRHFELIHLNYLLGVSFPPYLNKMTSKADDSLNLLFSMKCDEDLLS